MKQPGVAVAPRSPSTLRSVAVPNEHGGWGLTGEPVLLGLLIAPSIAGVLLGLAAVGAFLLRQPLRVVLVDHHRGRDLARTQLARTVVLVEGAILVVLAAGATLLAGTRLWWPALAATPLVALELWFDRRSRSHRLAPELAGAVGVSAAAAMIMIAGAHASTEAAAAWLILGARVTTAIPHVRAQIARLHERPTSDRTLVAADLLAVVLAAAATVADRAFAAGAVAVVAVIAVQRFTADQRVAPKVLGIRQSVMGLSVVIATALGFHLA
ncbi:YwiC-like family protein [Rhabdothermincola sediminis]|uniref:YwiC-like family protein n=1 Tax=Rhabdothermincola sediminis TaxID=2751370 RepID=UPI001AA0880E|nr:YwiC-like family protein [Rhabdothermincola sediminis]